MPHTLKTALKAEFSILNFCMNWCVRVVTHDGNLVSENCFLDGILSFNKAFLKRKLQNRDLMFNLFCELFRIE